MTSIKAWVDGGSSDPEATVTVEAFLDLEPGRWFELSVNDGATTVAVMLDREAMSILGDLLWRLKAETVA